MSWHHILAAMISFSGIYTSYKLLKPVDWSSHKLEEKKMLAHLTRASRDVKKKSLNKFIWSPIREGDALYNGEMLKTGEGSMASIKFDKNGTTMEVEPNSLVVIEESKENLSLGVIEGKLFVSSLEKNKSSGQLLLKSGAKSINIADGGEVAFSVGKEGEANVEVRKGKVLASIAGQKSMTLSGNDVGTFGAQGIEKKQQIFQDVHPDFGETVYLSHEAKNMAYFRWKPLSKRNEVVLELSKDGQNFTEQKIRVSGETGLLGLSLSSGHLYWRLVAYDKQNGEKNVSVLNKNFFQQKKPPLPLSPEQKEDLYITKGDPILFKWSLPTATTQLTLEVSNDERFKKIVYQQTLQSSSDKPQVFSHQTNSITQTGLYFWRLNALLKDSMETILSKTFQFTVNFGDILHPPKLISPEEKAIKTIGKEKNIEITLSWERQDKAKAYRVLLKKTSDAMQMEKMTKDPQFLFKGLTEGRYEWSVATIGNGDKVSLWSSKRSFMVQSMQAIAWKEMKNNYYFVDEFPSIILKWNQGLEKNSLWLIRVGSQKDLSLGISSEVTRPEWTFVPSAQGVYYAQVWALDENKNKIAESFMTTFNVTKRPPPKAPLFANSLANPLKGEAGGQLFLEFTNQISEENRTSDEKQTTYIVEITSLKGDIVQSLKWSSPKGKVENLMPGNYLVRAKMIDGWDREGRYSETRKAIIPNSSKITAPKLDSIKIRGVK